jgi:hypothetical protein
VQKVALWKVDGNVPNRIEESQVELERSLEEWIESDPSLLEGDLAIVARQLQTEAGRLDLLGIDPNGRWQVIEIKRGALTRETIAQALDYASCIAAFTESDLRAAIEPYVNEHGSDLDTILEDRDAVDSLDPAQREVAILIVGVGRTQGLDRIASFLAEKFSVPLSVISFNLFDVAEGTRVLAREITEPVAPDGQEGEGPVFRPTDVLRLAEQSGNGDVFHEFMNTAVEHGLYPRAWKTSIMFTPPSNRTRMLFTIWARPQKGLLKTYVGGSVFTEYFPTTIGKVRKHLGNEGWRLMDAQDAKRYLRGFRRLFAEIEEAESTDD